MSDIIIGIFAEKLTKQNINLEVIKTMLQEMIDIEYIKSIIEKYIRNNIIPNENNFEKDIKFTLFTLYKEKNELNNFYNTFYVELMKLKKDRNLLEKIKNQQQKKNEENKQIKEQQNRIRNIKITMKTIKINNRKKRGLKSQEEFLIKVVGFMLCIKESNIFMMIFYAIRRIMLEYIMRILHR